MGHRTQERLIRRFLLAGTSGLDALTFLSSAVALVRAVSVALVHSRHLLLPCRLALQNRDLLVACRCSFNRLVATGYPDPTRLAGDGALLHLGPHLRRRYRLDGEGTRRSARARMAAVAARPGSHRRTRSGLLRDQTDVAGAPDVFLSALEDRFG